jgi:hypothetical protein
LEFLKPIEKGKCKHLTGYYDGNRDYFGMFEDEKPQAKQEIEKTEVKKERIKKEKIVDHLVN